MQILPLCAIAAFPARHRLPPLPSPAVLPAAKNCRRGPLRNVGAFIVVACLFGNDCCCLRGGRRGGGHQVVASEPCRTRLFRSPHTSSISASPSLSLSLSLSLLLYRSAFLPSTAVVEPPGWCSCLPFWRARCLLGRLRAGRYFVELMMLKSRPAFALPPPSLVRWRLEVQRAGRRPQTYTRTHTRTHISAQARIETRRREAQLRVSGHAPSPAESLDACVCACCLCGCLSP